MRKEIIICFAMLLIYSNPCSSFDFFLSICDCTEWVHSECGLGPCTDSEMLYRRECNYAFCGLSECVLEECCFFSHSAEYMFAQGCSEDSDCADSTRSCVSGKCVCDDSKCGAKSTEKELSKTSSCDGHKSVTTTKIQYIDCACGGCPCAGLECICEKGDTATSKKTEYCDCGCIQATGKCYGCPGCTCCDGGSCRNCCSGSDASCGCKECEDCNKKDGYYKKFNLGPMCIGDVFCAAAATAEYRDYYCDGTECKYTTGGDETICESGAEKCDCGCSSGGCAECSACSSCSAWSKTSCGSPCSSSHMGYFQRTCPSGSSCDNVKCEFTSSCGSSCDSSLSSCGETCECSGGCSCPSGCTRTEAGSGETCGSASSGRCEGNGYCCPQSAARGGVLDYSCSGGYVCSKNPCCPQLLSGQDCPSSCEDQCSCIAAGGYTSPGDSCGDSCKTALDSCSETCNCTGGCSCPSGCAKMSASDGRSCGRSGSDSLTLRKGWNLISVPVGSMSLSDFENTCAIQPQMGSKLWTLSGGAWQNPQSFESGTGYFIKSSGICSISFGSEAGFSNIAVKKGFNMISAPGKTLDEIRGDCRIKTYLNYEVWEYDGSWKGLSSSSVMSANKGYYVKVDSDCTLHL